MSYSNRRASLLLFVIAIWAIVLGACAPTATLFAPDATRLAPTAEALTSSIASPTPPPPSSPTLTPSPPMATATRSPEQMGLVVITWQHTDESGRCLQARIRARSLETGACVGPQAIYALDEGRQAELAQFLRTFYTFEADTPAGHVIFKGTNRGQNAVPFPSQERMLATWAWAVSEAARSGRAPAWDLALEWNREEGGGCEKLRVHLTGFAQAFVCDGGKLAELGWKRLGPGDLAQLYDWYDRFEPVHTTRFELSGRGPERANEVEQGAIDRYAEGLYALLAALAPGAAGAPVEPFATAAYIRFEGWSPDSRWSAYWLSSQQDMDNQLPGTMPGGTLHFASMETGQTCAVSQFHTQTDQEARVDWVERGRAVVVIREKAFQGVPCQAEPFTPLADYRPAQEAPPDPALSPDGRYRAATRLASSQNGLLTFETTLVAADKTQPLQSVTWQAQERIGDHGLGGEWVSRTQFLIYETMNQGPLLLDVEQGVIPVLTGLLGLEEIPAVLGDEEYSLHATAAPGVEPDTFHLAVSGVGSEAHFPPARLYHAESGLVETLPYQKVWGFSAKNEWLFLYAGVEHTSYEIGNHLWARRLEDVGGEWRLIAPVFDYLLWREDESELAFIQNETGVVWQTFPAAERLGSWHTGQYGVVPAAFSPDGHYLVVLGNIPGEWEYGLFVLERNANGSWR